MRRLALLSLILVSVTAPLGFAAGCGNRGASGTMSPSGGGGGGGGTQSDACARFIECSKQAQPDSVAGAEAAYGPSGACWTTQSPDACEAACAQGTAALHALSPSSSACALCQTDADCGGGTPTCSASRGECVACATSAQCHAPTPACDPVSSTCVACAGAADCHAPLPACDTGTHTCVECTSGAQCASGACEPDHTCCVASSPCEPTSCGTITDTCGKPVACGGCGGGQYCDTQTSSCADITKTYNCDANGTHNTCTKYQQYCQYYFNGPGTTAWCSALPAQCQATPTCACLLAAHAYFPPDTCQEGTGPNGAGAVYVTAKP